MQAHNLIPFPNQLAALESEAEAQLEASKQSFLEFVATLQVIQDSALWQKDYPTWRDYLKTRWGLSDSTLRVKRMHARYAETIMNIVANAAFSETDIRKVKARLSSLTNDKELQAATYAKAHEHTGNIVPSEKALQIAYEEIVRAQQQDILTIEGVDYNARDLVIDANIQQELYELGKRKTAHIEASQGIESKRLEISQNQAITALFAALGMDVPQGHDYVLYWKESRK